MNMFDKKECAAKDHYVHLFFMHTIFVISKSFLKSLLLQEKIYYNDSKCIIVFKKRKE